MTKAVLSATEVSEMLLARTGDAMMSNDFDTFAECFWLPYQIETLEGQRSIDTLKELHFTFDAVREHLVIQRVTLMARHCVSASFRSPNEVAATHETRMISGELLVQEPFPAFSIIKRDAADRPWRISYTSYVIVDSTDLNNALNA